MVTIRPAYAGWVGTIAIAAMYTIPKQTLVVELGEVLEDYTGRQREFVQFLRELRAELRQFRPRADVLRMYGPTRGTAARVPVIPRPHGWLAQVGSPPPSPARAAAGSPVPGPTTGATGANSADRPPRSVGSPGHSPKRDYNYFSELDERLARLRAAPGSTPS
jgi:hypothetical protein